MNQIKIPYIKEPTLVEKTNILVFIESWNHSENMLLDTYYGLKTMLRVRIYRDKRQYIFLKKLEEKAVNNSLHYCVISTVIQLLALTRELEAFSLLGIILLVVEEGMLSTCL